MTRLPLILILCMALQATAVLAANATTSAQIGNAPPIASSASLNGGSAITLTANTTTQINASATISDSNGCLDVTSASAVLYRTSVGVGASDNNLNHYSIACTRGSDCSGALDNTVTYTCSFDLYWYADPTDAGSAYESDQWEVQITPSDDQGTGTEDNDSRELNTLTAFSLLDSSISFGTLDLGGNTTNTNQETRLENHGNEQLDINVRGYGLSELDGLAMTCDTGNISVSYLEYHYDMFTYGSGTDLTNSDVEMNIDLAQGNELDSRPETTIYYGLGVPGAGVQGSCSGTVVLSAVSDPGQD